MKSNLLSFTLFAYIILFGISVRINDPIKSHNTEQCKPPPTLNLETPPTIPQMSKESMEDKDLMMRLLIQHIYDQNQYIENRNKQLTDIYNQYSKCITE